MFHGATVTSMLLSLGSHQAATRSPQYARSSKSCCTIRVNHSCAHPNPQRINAMKQFSFIFSCLVACASTSLSAQVNLGSADVGNNTTTTVTATITHAGTPTAL